MKRILMIMFAVVMVANEALAFKALGNQTIAAIAEKHLSAEAKSEVKAILKGKTMAQNAIWLNSLKKNPALAHTQKWFYFTLAANGKSTTMDENDGVVQIEKAVNVLRNRKNESDSLVVASLRTVIQLVGDMHCLSHVRIEGNEPSYGFDFKHWNNLNGKGSKTGNMRWLGLWENSYINRHDVFSPEYYGADIEVFLGHKKTEYEKGTPRFWVENVGEDVVRCLEVLQPGVTINTEVINRFEDVHNRCLAKGGYRLAALLNDIFK